ncbi:MAG: hypothetical protein Ct9H300mP23_02330 [Nitrospinota bacterium]|nr:MAG: hypothetical protein Ct9H300mP23_02330 [Nitrospinota bacterium]
MYVLDKNMTKLGRKKRKMLRHVKINSTQVQFQMVCRVSYSAFGNRGNQGECVRVKFTNRLEDEDAGFQINGSAMIISSSGQPNTAAMAGSIVPAEETQEYEWYIPLDEQEGDT